MRWWTGGVAMLGLAGCGHASAEDCTATVPAGAAVVRDGDVYSDASGSSVYVCPGATAEVDAANQTVFVGAGATLDFSGASSTVYADAGSTVTLGGAGTTIYAESDVVVDLRAIDQDLRTCSDVVLQGAPDCSLP